MTKAAAAIPHVGVRVHARHILAVRPTWTPEEHALALAGLKDEDANVRRAAADALGLHPATENIRPLLDLRHAVPADDTHLLHVVRMALRDQLLSTTAYDHLPREGWEERDARAIADVSLGVPTRRGVLPTCWSFAEVLRRRRRPGDVRPSRRPLRRCGDDVCAPELCPRPIGPAILARQATLLKAILTRNAGAWCGAVEGPAHEWAEQLVGNAPRRQGERKGQGRHRNRRLVAAGNPRKAGGGSRRRQRHR